MEKCASSPAARGASAKGSWRHSLREGARRVWALDVNDERVSPRLKKAPFRVTGVAVDVTSSAAVNAVVERIRTESGGIDVLVNNAGITRDAIIHKMSDADWDAVINVNLKGVFFVTRAVAPLMMEAGAGAVVSISSVVGLDGNIGQTNYAATKGGVVAMTKGWAREFVRKGAKDARQRGVSRLHAHSHDCLCA